MLNDLYIFAVQKLASVVWGIRYNPKRYWAARGLVYRKESERAFKEKPYWNRNTTLILETLKSYQFSSFLDVGCGYGLYLKSIEQEFKLDKIAGCDISPSQIKEAKKFLGPTSKVTLIETDGENLPYRDKSFDITFTYGVCIHVPHEKITHFIKEILRVTRKHYIFLESSLGKDSLYYVSHDYPAIFKEIGVNLEVLKELGPNERIYAANL